MAIYEDTNDENPRTCVVLGGRSFIGRSLVSKLLKLENWIVRIADSGSSLDLDPKEQNSFFSEAISSGRASYFQVDVRDKWQLSRAIEGSEVVFHLDTTDTSLRDICLHYMITVQGTKNVINACRECQVKKLIYNSSADVVFNGMHDIFNGDESLPYPWKFEDVLSDFKAQAEALVMFANTSDGLLTCALRPSNAFGPGGGHLLPFLLGAARSGWDKVYYICYASSIFLFFDWFYFLKVIRPFLFFHHEEQANCWDYHDEGVWMFVKAQVIKLHFMEAERAKRQIREGLLKKLNLREAT